MRKPSELEMEAFKKLAGAVLPIHTQQQFLQDLQNCVVSNPLADDAVIRFHIHDYDRPPYRGQHSLTGMDGFPVGGALFKLDGSKIELWLYFDENNRVLEVELINWDGTPVIDVPWESFQLN